MLSVSIAMATYNGQKYIRQQLESLAAQTYAPAELVITDDGSSDDTLSIIAEFAKSVPFPVHAHRNDVRLGFRGNFIRAASLCRSDLIAFCDQDDRWYDQKIEACVERFKDPDILLVYHNADVVTDDGKRLGSLQEFSASGPLVPPMSFNPMYPVPGFTQMFRHCMLQHSHLWDRSQDHRYAGEPMAHDQWFYFLAAILGKIGYLKEPLAAYIQHGQNTCGYGGGGRVNHLRLMMKYALQNSPDQSSRAAAAADVRAAILDAVKIELDGVQRERAETAAGYYRRLSQLHSIRIRIHAATSFWERLTAFLKLLARGGYGGAWSLSPRSLIKDICIGVPIGPYFGQLRPKEHETMSTPVRSVLKKSRFLHSVYKLGRDAGDVPPAAWLDLRQIYAVLKIYPETMLPLPRLFDARKAILTINEENILGDIVECGVWNGGCIGLMGLTDTTERPLHLFDSFEGLPQPTKEDSDLVTKHGAKDLKLRETEPIEPIQACVGNTKDRVERFLSNLGLTNLVFHVGWFQDTVPVAKIDKIALLRLDGDWYESTKVCLEGLFDKVSPGGFVIIDDYGCFEGCKRAVDEFFASRGLQPSLIYSDSMCVYFRKAA